MQQHVARPQQRQEDGADRRHARRGDRRRLGPVQQGQPVLDDLQIRMVEPAVHQPAGPHAFGAGLRPATTSKNSAPSSAFLNAKVEVKNTGGFTAPSDMKGS